MGAGPQLASGEVAGAPCGAGAGLADRGGDQRRVGVAVDALGDADELLERLGGVGAGVVAGRVPRRGRDALAHLVVAAAGRRPVEVRQGPHVDERILLGDAGVVVDGPRGRRGGAAGLTGHLARHRGVAVDDGRTGRAGVEGGALRGDGEERLDHLEDPEDHELLLVLGSFKPIGPNHLV